MALAKATELIATEIIGQMKKPDEGGEDYGVSCIASGGCVAVVEIG